MTGQLYKTYFLISHKRNLQWRETTAKCPFKKGEYKKWFTITYLEFWYSVRQTGRQTKVVYHTLSTVMPKAAHFLAINTHIFISFCAWIIFLPFFTHPSFFSGNVSINVFLQKDWKPYGLSVSMNMFNCFRFMCMKWTCLHVRA